MLCQAQGGAERPVWPQQHERAMAEAEKAIRTPRPELGGLYRQHRKVGCSSMQGWGGGNIGFPRAGRLGW